ncbi:TetR/AcrR family transcriptional regulator [Amycolatopsis aidingensis]|uniref:TetR/AcrR family transcriptional regulator n=1 Tax=Amycolatopsis aidingensis TaxID=2842453 RepID=UPI001E295814|nr:TetR/AcrR family transcriptional regulator [Amycolatopsis aidingensis]
MASGRDRMLDGAIAVFRERGVAGTSLTEIVERSGAPRGSLYHYFPEGKTQLATEATERAGRFMGATISSLAAAGDPIDAIDTIIEFFRGQLESGDFESGCPVAAGALGGAESEGARRAAGEAFSSWESTVAAALWQHGVAAERAETMATLAIAAIEGALVLARAQRSTRPLDRVATELTAQARLLLGR